MASPAAILSVLVKANTAQANLGLAKVNAQARMTATHFGEIDKGAGKTSKALASMAKVGIGGAVAGLAGVAVVAKKAFSEFEEAQKVTRQTEAVLKSTGNAAKVTADQVEQLANAISLKSGIDDEAIQSGENLLLTFTKIRNETGKGNDVFNQATQVITDMSVALDQDLKSSAIQVGKALQDPQKGITALRRVGVNFTQTQQDMIEKWVKHGQILRAQKFILRELTNEFGGSAKAQATGAAKLRVALDNLLEQFGKTFGPALEKAMAQAARFINQMQTGRGAGGRFARQMESLGKTLRDLWPTLRTTAELVGAFAGVTKTVAGVRIPAFIQVLLRFANPITRFIDFVRLAINVVRTLSRWFTSVSGTGRKLAGTVGDTLAGAFQGLKSAVNTALAPLRKAYNLLKDIADIAGGVVGKIGSVGKSLNPFGAGQPLEDFFGQFSPFTGPLGKMGANSVDAFNSVAAKFGLTMTSGFRPGDDGWHGQNRARDYSDGYATPHELAFAKFMAQTFGGKLLELIHTPLGFGIKNGKKVPLGFWGSAINADHYDHVHVAMQRGGGVGGTGSGDKVPALLEPGEFVMNRNATRRAGPMLAALNRGIPRFASGGYVRNWSRAVAAGRGAGFRGRALQMMLAIGGAESGGYTRFVGDGGQSFGPWQIYHPAHPQYNTSRLLSDWTYSARAVREISGGGKNWNPWTMFRNGGYLSYLNDALWAMAGKGDPGDSGKPLKGKAKAKLRRLLPGGVEHFGNDPFGGRKIIPLIPLEKGPGGDQGSDVLSTVADSAVDVAALVEMLRLANLRTAVSQAQYGTLRGVYGGSFANGGIVPGPLGQPRMVVAHGGETITPAGGLTVVVNGDIVNVPRGKKAVEVRDIRGTGRDALPGRGGGITRLG